MIEWRSFQPTSILSYLRTKTKFSLLDLPASTYWSDWVRVMKCLKTSKNLQHMSKHYFRSTSLEWAETVFKECTCFWSLFSKQHRNIGIYIYLWLPGSVFFLALTEEDICENNLVVTTDSIPLWDLRYRGNSVSGVLSLIKPNFSCFRIILSCDDRTDGLLAVQNETC